MTTTGHDPSTGKLPDRWGLFPLADLLAVSIGGVWGSEEGESEVDVNVIRVTELKPHGVIDPSTAARRSITRKQLVSRRLSEGDLLLEKSGGGPKTPVGRVGMVPSLDADSVCANFMLLMRVNPDLVNCRLLHLFLNFFHSDAGTVEFQTATTNIRNIKTADYLQVPIPVPLLAEQARIVEILEGHLSRLDAALQHIQTLRDKASQFRRSLLHAAFTGALTGHDFQETEQALESVLELLIDHRGKTPKKLGSDFVDSGVRVVSAIHIKHREVRFEERHRFVTEEIFEKWMPERTRAGDVLFTSEAPLGSVALVPDDAPLVLSQRLFCLRGSSDQLRNDYLRLFLESPDGQDRLTRRSSGTTVTGIRQSELRQVLVPVPPLHLQKRIVEILEGHLSRLDAAMAVADAVEERAGALRRSLLHAAFTGKLTEKWREQAHV